MRIATWNINGLRARFDYLLYWLRDRKPDLVGLQELKAEEENFPFTELKAEGYEALVHGQKAWNGVAILSRQESRLRRVGLPNQEGAGARLISAEYQGIHFVTVYCPNGKSIGHKDFPKKLEWFDSLRDFIQNSLSPDKPVVLCGDFNICPGSLDSWNEKELNGQIFHTLDERERFRNLIDWGFMDVFRHFHPDLKKFSWWDYRAGAFYKNQGLRIDLILATSPLASKIRNIEIDRDYRKKKEGLTASDHAPVFCDVDL